jgi:hypothetical protein
MEQKSFNEGLNEFEELAKQGNWVNSNLRFLATLLGDLKREKLNARASKSVSDILRLVEENSFHIGALAPDDDANIFHGYGLSADEAFANARLLLHMGHPSAALEIIETLLHYRDEWLNKNFGELEVILAELKKSGFDNGEDLARLVILNEHVKRISGRSRSDSVHVPAPEFDPNFDLDQEVPRDPSQPDIALPPTPETERREGTSIAKVKRKIDNFVAHRKIDGALFDDVLKEITKGDLQLHDLSETLRKDGDAAPQLDDRYANFAFMQSGTVLDAGRAIAPETDCELRFNIGPLTSDRIPEKAPDGLQPDPKPFPLYALPPASEGHCLDVVIASRDFEIEKGKYRVFLPLSGSSWVCDCNPRNGHTCTSDTRRDHLFVPVKTPKARNAGLRVGVCVKNNLLQSYLLTVAVATTQDGACRLYDRRIVFGFRPAWPKDD